MRKLLGVLSVCVMSLIYVVPASADWGAGITLQAGTYETDGSETEKTVTGVTSETTNHSEKESFYGASVYVEKEFSNGFVVGLDYVPMSIELGAAERIDADGDGGTAGTIAADTDDGTRKASAEIDGLTTVYAHVPVGPMYLLLGYHDATIETTETLQTSSYGNVSVNGIQYGLGVKGDHVRFEVAYSDFDDVEITATGNTITGAVTSQNKVSADADVLAFRVSFGF